ncbi:MAG: T9SS type A sorting domain-containing protein [Chitinophagaceae bacterium]
MKLVAIFLIFFTFISPTHSQKIDTITTFEWDTAAHMFKNNAQQVFTYNGACYLTRYIYSFWDSTSASYIKYYRTTNSLLSNNATSQSLTQLWDEASKKWDNYQKGIYGYTTSQTLPSTVLYQDYQTSNSSWLNSRLYTYTYDANGNNTNILIQEWKTASSSWTNLFQNQYTFNTNNLMTSFLQLTWDVANSAWVNFNKIDYTYFPNNKLLQDSGKKWSGVNSGWIYTYRSQYFYDTNNFLKSWEYNTWDTTLTSYQKSQQYEYVNNANGNAIQMLTLNWNGVFYDTVFNDVNHYNACILPVKLISFNAQKVNSKVYINWQTGEEINTSYFNIQRSLNSNSFENIGQINAESQRGNNYNFIDVLNTNLLHLNIYYRLEIVDKNGSKSYSSIKEIYPDNDKNVVTVFPNPATSYINIKGLKIKQIQIKDIAGRILMKQVFANNNSIINIPTKSLSKGIVLLEIIHTDNTLHSEKIIIQ